MINLPISKFMKNYYEENGYEFTDFQKAAIIWNAGGSPWHCEMASRSEIFAMLRELADTTADEVLKAQINERLEYEEAQEQAFYKKTEGSIYTVKTYYDDDSFNFACFRDIRLAVEYGKAKCENRFGIEKYAFFDDVKEGEEEQDFLGEVLYRKNGEIYYCHSSECEKEEPCVEGHFEYAYFKVKHPFDRGDIVRCEGDDEPMIVEWSKEEDKELEERIKSGGDDHRDYSDMALLAEYIYDDGGMMHGHPNPLYLEPVTEWEDEDVWRLLNATSNLIKGRGHMDEFWAAYDPIDKICVGRNRKK